MRMNPMMGPPADKKMKERLIGPAPKNLKEVPGFLKRIITGFFTRLFYVFRLVWEAKKSLLLFLLFFTVFNGLMPLAGTFITANLLAKVVLSFTQEVNLMLPLALQFGYIFLNNIMSSVNHMVTRLSGEIITNHVKVKIMKKAKTVDLASFDMPDFYERLENANREAGIRPVNILIATFELFSKLISMVSYIVVLFSLLAELDFKAYILFAVFVIASFVSALVTFYYRQQNFLYMRRNSRERRELTYYSDRMVDKDMVKEIRLFDLSDFFIGRYNNIFKRYFSGAKRIIVKEGGCNILMSFLTGLLNAGLFYLAATNVTQIADYSVYTGALNSISACVTVVISTCATIYEGSLFTENMMLFMDEKTTIAPTTENPVLPKRHCGHTIELKNVSFSYPGTQRKVLDGVSFKINAGETAVLVGFNGAGKTTLIKLITRLYDPTEGEILLDGINIKEYSVSDLYKIFGIIFQDFGKYAVSAGENIRFGNIQNDSVEDIIKAAEASGAHGFIKDFEKGYDTQLTRFFDPDGTDLSIGQWQKLSVARAFYSDSDILILDEPTASLDAIAEQEIFKEFDELRRDKTTVFVSHRLSSAVGADVIIVLDNGRVTEIGNHRELMEKEGLYHRLFTTQAQRYIEQNN